MLAVGQSALGFAGHDIVFSEARRDLDLGLELLTERDDALFDAVVFHDVDAAGAGDGLDGTRRNEQRRSGIGLPHDPCRLHRKLDAFGSFPPPSNWRNVTYTWPLPVTEMSGNCTSWMDGVSFIGDEKVAP